MTNYAALSPFKRDVDPADRLPAAARAKLEAVRFEAKRSQSASQIFYAEMQSARERARACEAHVGELMTRYNLSANHPQVVEENKNLDRLKTEHHKATELYQSAKDNGSTARKLAERAERYVVEKLPGRRIEAAKVPTPKLAKGESFHAAVDAQRALIEKLNGDIAVARDAPRPAAEARQIARDWLDRLAAQGAPDVMPTIESGFEPLLASTTPGYRYSLMSPSAGQIDPIRLILWACKPQIAAGLEKLIDQYSDDASALSSAERARRIPALQAEIFDTELQEEALIAAAQAAGQPIERRPDADIRAVLGLSSTNPEP